MQCIYHVSKINIKINNYYYKRNNLHWDSRSSIAAVGAKSLSYFKKTHYH